jgi:hypothetical protein
MQFFSENNWIGQNFFWVHFLLRKVDIFLNQPKLTILLYPYWPIWRNHNFRLYLVDFLLFEDLYWKNWPQIRTNLWMRGGFSTTSVHASHNIQCRDPTRCTVFFYIKLCATLIVFKLFIVQYEYERILPVSFFNI